MNNSNSLECEEVKQLMIFVAEKKYGVSPDDYPTYEQAHIHALQDFLDEIDFDEDFALSTIVEKVTYIVHMTEAYLLAYNVSMTNMEKYLKDLFSRNVDKAMANQDCEINIKYFPDAELTNLQYQVYQILHND